MLKMLKDGVCSILKPKNVLSKGIRISNIFIIYWHYPPSYRVFDRWNLKFGGIETIIFFRTIAIEIKINDSKF